MEAAFHAGVTLQRGNQQLVAALVYLLEHFVRLTDRLVVMKDKAE